MTDQQPFTPPGAPTPPAPAPSTPVQPAPLPAAAPRRGWVVPVVLLSAVGFVGIVLAVIIAIMLTMPGFLAAAPTTSPAPVAEQPGEEDPAPVAGDGTFDLADAEAITLDASRYAELGFVPVADTEYHFDLVDDQRDNVSWWTEDKGDPDACYFSYPKAPLLFSPTLNAEPTVADDAIYYPLSYSDASQTYYLTQGVRVFDDASGAAAHLTEMDRALVGCTQYSLPTSGYAALVEPARALDLPADVAAVGWVETSGPGRFYGYDLQRGNLVVRVSLASDADGPSENEYRTFVEDVALLLASLEP